MLTGRGLSSRLAASLIRAQSAEPGKPALKSFSRSWRDSAQEGLAYQSSLGAERYWVLRYEDLILQPEEYIRKICDFLGIQDEPTLRRPTRNGKDWGGNSMFGERFQRIDTSPLGRWKQSLSVEEALITEWNAAPALQHLDYPASETRWQAVITAISPRLIKAWVATKILRK